LRNPRKTAAVSSSPREESAGSFGDSGRASAAFALFAFSIWICGNLIAQDNGSRLSAQDIMTRVAANQDREQSERVHFLYDQHIRVSTRYSNGKLAREEMADFTVTPTPSGVEKKRVNIQGRYRRKGAYEEFKGEPVPDEDTLDGGLASSMRDDLTNEKSKDGLGKDLFPLTSEEQKDLEFELAGETVLGNRPAYRIRFRPKDSHDIGWAGEAIIDKEELQPVSVYTRLSKRLPLFVRSLLGTNVPGLGFNTHYRRLDKDIWFPDSFGTEFRLHAVFFINRTITVSMENNNFQRATVDSAIHYE
jgi:hypothetical protein